MVSKEQFDSVHRNDAEVASSNLVYPTKNNISGNGVTVAHPFGYGRFLSIVCTGRIKGNIILIVYVNCTKSKNINLY